ncbi:cation-translocating P-type ATPase [Marilutibacter alkalisoli]|uniref:P-type Cu(+) transporter n=1 Tax=Marilutibacter alkalisoli TaxID=2591633 RepID=A0A514BNS1_9GAMM|nr:HAD-IC family P-type ATPase [Lysobacter alkalisoli]QDH69037.1 HAD-IC family P-type ATPase [Lysobacter alkalisoli]
MAPETPPFHCQGTDAVLAGLSSSRTGLSAADAEARLACHGPNRLPEGRSRTVLEVFLTQFRSPFIYLLLAAGLVSLLLSHMADAVFIFAVLLINAAIGCFQEWRAETRSRALRALIKGTVAVWRDGRLQRLPTEVLVPGDVVQVESGERVAADLRLIEARNLLVDESLLTGESAAVLKHADAMLESVTPLPERVTMLHAGTTIQVGRGLAVVVASGDSTTVGQLAAELERPDAPPPLVRRMARFTRHVVVAVVVVIALITALELMRGASAGDIFLLAVALAVSAIPEGLPVAMTVALSIATHRMSLRNVMVRHLPAVEGLGACTLIATDKTGTLTQNVLTVERLWVAGAGEVAPDAAASKSLLVAAARASERAASSGEGVSGDAVDLAFLDAAAAHGWCPDDDDPALVVARVPYEPQKRFAASIHADAEGLVAYAKGAPETILSLCGHVAPAAQTAVEYLSGAGYRVIAVAEGRVANAHEDGLGGLCLLGFAGLIDPLRPEARGAVHAAQSAGIRVVMVTGDHPRTAAAIAGQLGLELTPDAVVTGAELAALPVEGFDAATSRASVFARTEPLQKLAIVESLRRDGHVVAVTGDGVNDAPALHAADIGVAMGKAGTDVARDAADLVLADDNFASIVSGIEEGRIAYDNLRKVIALAISTGVAEVMMVLVATLTGLPQPLTAVQLLWLNLVTNGMQHVALAFEKGEADVLQRRPRAANAPVFDRRMIEQVLLGGAVIGSIGYVFYYFALATGMEHVAAQGAVLWLLVWCENAHCFNCRSESESAFRIPLWHNPLLVAAVIGTQLLQIAVLAIPPLRDLLSLQAMTIAEGLQLGALALIVLFAMELYKMFRRRHPING